MKFLSTFEKRMLYGYFKKNVGWLCLEPYAFQKKCRSKCWVHKFFWELHFVNEESKFLSYMECHAIIARIMEKYSKEKDFKKSFNRQIIDNVMIDAGENWRLCLIGLDYNPFIF